jgi:transposase
MVRGGQIEEVASKIAVILHRMWIDGTTYRWTEVQPIAALA